MSIKSKGENKMIKLLGDYENYMKVHYDEENEGVEINMSFFVSNEDMKDVCNGEEIKKFEDQYKMCNSSDNRSMTDDWLEHYDEDFKTLVRKIVNFEVNNSYTAILNEDEIINFTNDEEILEQTNKCRVVDKIDDMIRELEQMKIEMMDD